MGKGQKYFDSGDYNMAKQGGRLGRGEIKRVGDIDIVLSSYLLSGLFNTRSYPISLTGCLIIKMS